MKQIIWTSSMDLSPEGVEKFCREAAGRYGKTESELRALSLMELSSCYMWNERRRAFRDVHSALSVPVHTPILVIAAKADFLGGSHKECSVLSGERLSEILNFEPGVPRTYFSDGKDIWAEELSDTGANIYLYRAVTTLRGLGAFISHVEAGDFFTESQLSAVTRSLAPQVHGLLGWQSEHAPLDHQIRQAAKQNASSQDRELSPAVPER